MKIFNKNHLAFTLIEVIVAVTILSIILISVMSIYITSTDINLKTDITRALQQNVKSVVEVIAEDIRKSSKKNISVEMDKDNL
jgi:prepilin-type N-terminal cleavage/methylation domain-containing protein